MKKLSMYSALSLSAMMLVSCSQMKRQMKKDPSHEMSSLMDTVQIEKEDLLAKKPKTGEYTHEMAEATADDVEIKHEVGSTEIDDDLPGTEPKEIPYSRDFLQKKNTKRMQFWVDYFTKKNRDRFQRFINNGEEYRHHIEEVFQQYGLPKELYYVGLIESGYYLGARSHASAVGPWQFIRATGRRYGMAITPELDERQDLFKSTHAAAQYFKNLHRMLGSWELALAAYNAGENGMLRRMIKYGTRDFYVLSRNKRLPSETINYVPKVLAAMHVVHNASRYGFVIPKKKHRLFDLTELKPVKKNVRLHTIAKRINIDVKLIRKLNPELKRSATPRRFAGTYMLRLPKARYAYNLDDLAPSSNDVGLSTPAKFARPESRKERNRRTAKASAPKFHKVRRGETLISLSKKYHIPARKLAAANDFKSWNTNLRIGQKIKIGHHEEQIVSTRQAGPKVKITNKPIIYKVTKGDNLTKIAQLFNSPLSKIKRVNNLKRGKIIVGQKIVLPNTQKGIYTVKRGDHLTKVAKNFNVPVSTLMKINSMTRRKILVGQKLIVNMD